MCVSFATKDSPVGEITDVGTSAMSVMTQNVINNPKSQNIATTVCGSVSLTIVLRCIKKHLKVCNTHSAM